MIVRNQETEGPHVQATRVPRPSQSIENLVSKKSTSSLSSIRPCLVASLTAITTCGWQTRRDPHRRLPDVRETLIYTWNSRTRYRLWTARALYFQKTSAFATSVR